ncbi:MAG: sigma-54-dependent transcriptional regulator, partial [Lysobacter sp.]
MLTGPILVADDDENIQMTLRMLLKKEGYSTEAASSPNEIIAALNRQLYSLLLIDLNFQRDTTSGVEGLSLLPQIRAIDPDLPIVVMTGWGSIELAVEAIRSGASDFIEKPWNNARVTSTVNNLIELHRGRKTTARLREENTELRKEQTHSNWIAVSPAMEHVMTVVDQVAGANINILLTGENGTGKSQLAALIHAQSLRRTRPFVTVNMSAIPDGLFESELYGHTKGAFTDARTERIGRFEVAEGGTLFMDEIGNLPLSQQAKLLHVLETGQFEKLGSSQSRFADVRIITATNADLPTLIKEGNFRQDLLYRLKGIEIRLPPLRERKSEILCLADAYLNRHAAKYGRSLSGFTDNAQMALHAYDWPGNVRELDHVVERATLLARGRYLDVTELGLQTSPVAPTSPMETWEDLTLEDAEKQLLQIALR